MKKTESSKKVELVIDRSRWLTGEYCDVTSRRSKLLDSYGMMCCLGFAAKTAGCSDRKILDVEVPARVNGNVSMKKLEKLNLLEGELNNNITHSIDLLVNDAMCINDMSGSTLSRKMRERKIKRVLGELNFEVKFTGRYPNYEKIK
jgi:hypothetical protein